MTSGLFQGRPATVLVVAGSDPTAGAGLQADMKTVGAMGGYALTAVTAVTVQDTRRVYDVHPLPPDLVACQMRTVLADMGADCIKLGMLATGEIMVAVAGVLAEWPDVPVVVDPVLAGTGGGILLDGAGRERFLNLLRPRVTLLTPNLPEAAALAGLAVDSVADMERAARHLARDGCAVLVTGGHLLGAEITNLLFDGQQLYTWTSPRLPGPGFHGTGCTLASAIATALAGQKPLPEAVAQGLDFVRQALTRTVSLGKGQRLLAMSG